MSLTDWVPLRDAATFLGVSKSTIKVLIEHNKLVAVRCPCGRSRIVHTDELERRRDVQIAWRTAHPRHAAAVDAWRFASLPPSSPAGRTDPAAERPRAS